MTQKMSTTIIEESAVNRLEYVLLQTGLVKPSINKNDRTASWDGELLVYRDKSMRKDVLRGRIPVQVKGQLVEKIGGDNLKFQASTADLRNYLNDGGVMFFVIQMDNSGRHSVYYASLQRFDLRRHLERAGNQKTKQITVRRFPEGQPTKINNTLFYFLSEREKQGMLLSNVRSVQDLKNTDLEIQSLELSVPTGGATNIDDMIESMFGKTAYVHAKIANLKESFVVDAFVPEKVSTTIQEPIIVGGECLFDHVDIVRESGKRESIEIGNGITIVRNENRLDLSFKMENTLRMRIAQLKLLQAMMAGEHIKIGPIETISGASDLSGISPESLQERLKQHLHIAEILDRLHIKKDFDLKSLSEDDLRLLDEFIRGMDGNPVGISINGKPGAGALTLGNLKIAISSKAAEEDGRFLISDMFACQDCVLSENGQSPEEGVPCSPYILLNCNLLQTLDNVDIQELAASVTSCAYSEVYGFKANQLALELLKYYDIMPSKDTAILNVVQRIQDYLLENEPDGIVFKQINKLQAIKRRRALSMSENQLLLSMKEEETSPFFLLGINILLESFKEADVLYASMPEAEQKAFDEFPIVHLWEGHCKESV